MSDRLSAQCYPIAVRRPIVTDIYKNGQNEWRFHPAVGQTNSPPHREPHGVGMSPPQENTL